MGYTVSSGLEHRGEEFNHTHGATTFFSPIKEGRGTSAEGFRVDDVFTPDDLSSYII